MIVRSRKYNHQGIITRCAHQVKAPAWRHYPNSLRLPLHCRAVEFLTFTQSLQRISSSTRTTLAIVRSAPTLAATVFTAKCPT